MVNDTARRWHRMVNAGDQEAVAATLELIDGFSRGKKDMLQYEYGRSALKLGLQLEKSSG